MTPENPHPDLSEIKARLSPVFDAWGIRRAVLFGSTAKGTATEQSDLDLLVDSGLRGLRFVGLIEDLRCAAGRPVDLFDVTHIQKGSRIEKEIDQTGVTIYER